MDQWWIVNLLTTKQGSVAKYQRSVYRSSDTSEAEITS